MSEAELGTNKAEALPPAQAEPATVVVKKSSALAPLALLIALAGVGVGGWSAWQLYQQSLVVEPEVEQEPVVTQVQWQVLSEQQQRLAEQLGRDSRAQKEQETVLAAVQAQQQQQQEQLTRLQSGAQRELRLAEAEHLLRLASLRLASLQDVGSAIALLEGADEVLKDQNDPTAYAARKSLASSLELLRSLPAPDRTGLFLRLAALRDQAVTLQAQILSFEPDAKPVVPDEPFWQRWLDQASSYVRLDVNATQNIRPLLAGQSLAQARLALTLAIEQAQWAVLNGNAEVYKQALVQAGEVLESHFSQDIAANKALHDRLAELKNELVSLTTPDLTPTLEVFEAYLKQRRQRLGEPEQVTAPEARPQTDPVVEPEAAEEPNT